MRPAGGAGGRAPAAAPRRPARPRGGGGLRVLRGSGGAGGPAGGPYDVTPGRQAGPGGAAGTLFMRATSAYQRALRFGIRRWVPKSTNTRPNRLEYPSAHSKLSRNDQTK